MVKLEKVLKVEVVTVEDKAGSESSEGDDE